MMHAIFEHCHLGAACAGLIRGGQLFFYLIEAAPSIVSTLPYEALVVKKQASDNVEASATCLRYSVMRSLGKDKRRYAVLRGVPVRGSLLA